MAKTESPKFCPECGRKALADDTLCARIEKVLREKSAPLRIIEISTILRLDYSTVSATLNNYTRRGKPFKRYGRGYFGLKEWI